MNRRSFTKYSFAAAAASLAASLPKRTRADTTTSAPNLLIIQTDEHNFKTLGCYRNHLGEKALVWGPDAIVETPNIDSIADGGAMAVQAYANTPVCSPSRSCWMSGRYAHRTPVTNNNIPMAANTATFADILLQNHYVTGYAGKWHLALGAERPGWQPENNFGFTDNRYMFNRGHWKQITESKDGIINQFSYIKGATAKNYTTDFLTDRALDFIETNQDNLFCYMLSLPDPHGPDTVRKPFNAMFKNTEFKIPESASNKPKSGNPSWDSFGSTMSKADMAQHFGMIACIDYNVGRIIDALKGHDLLNDTIIVFTADHGDLLGEHHRINKGVPLDGSAKIPFLIYYPAKIESKKVVKKAISCVDFAPSILSLMDITGLDQIDDLDMDGRDISHLFTGAKKPAGFDSVTYLRGTGNEGASWLAAVNHRFKLIYSPVDDPWMFDLKKDPNEQINQYTNPKFARVRKLLATHLLDYAVKFEDPYITDFPIIREQLEAAING